VTFYPDVAFAMVIPVAVNPVGVGMRCFDIGSGNPDVAVSVPAMIATVPCPILMLMGWGRDVFDWTLRRTDTNDHLGLGDACSEK
jgi:hypothetical protein